LKMAFCSGSFPKMARNVASIDLGTHTARLLVAQKEGEGGGFRALIRKRAYIRLAEDFGSSGKMVIGSDAAQRAIKAMLDFSEVLKSFRVRHVRAVATGVIREAENRDAFLNRIRMETGIPVRPITGEEEAILTGNGVRFALDLAGKDPYLIFDLGGGSTEFLTGTGKAMKARSIPLGAMTLTRRYLVADPPSEDQVLSLSRHIDTALEKALSGFVGRSRLQLIVGTGGTVTTLAALLGGISLEDVDPAKMDGARLSRSRLDTLFLELKGLSVKERSGLRGLDQGRADVIVAGALVVTRILHHFASSQLTVSMSDLLEGMLMNDSLGEGNEQE
jgi:exopolyphosphatase/guanosine-5'-triphosphate,3'-diphosphate pyrophosphatase